MPFERGEQKRRKIFGNGKCELIANFKGREENTEVEESEKERERGSNLRRQRPASPTAQVLVTQTTEPVQRIGFVTSFRATFGLTRSIGFDPRSRSFSLSSTSVFSSLPSTPVFISSRCRSAMAPLCPAPVRPGCLFCLFLSLLSPSSQPPIDRVSPNVALKLVTKDSLNQLSGRPGQSGWLGAAAVGSIPALALSHFLQRLYFLLFQTIIGKMNRTMGRAIDWP